MRKRGKKKECLCIARQSLATHCHFHSRSILKGTLKTSSATGSPWNLCQEPTESLNYYTTLVYNKWHCNGISWLPECFIIKISISDFSTAFCQVSCSLLSYSLLATYKLLLNHCYKCRVGVSLRLRPLCQWRPKAWFRCCFMPPNKLKLFRLLS